MELQRIGGAVAERLHREHVALGQQLAAARQIEAFAMPLINVVGPGLADREAGRGRPDRVVADLGVAFRMGVDPAAELARQHLRAQADAEKRLVLLQRHRDPVDLAADELFLIVGAHRTAEDDRAGMARMVAGSGSPKRGRRMSSGKPRVLRA